MSTITIETPVKPPGAVDAGAGGEEQAMICVLVAMLPAPPPESYVNLFTASLLRGALETALSKAQVGILKITAVGPISNTLARVDVNRADVLRAVSAIREWAEPQEVGRWTGIFWLDGDEKAFRTVYWGGSLGPMITLTREELETRLADIKATTDALITPLLETKLRDIKPETFMTFAALMEAMRKIGEKPAHPPDEPSPPGAGDGPAT
jgi:hypothetical protein